MLRLRPDNLNTMEAWEDSYSTPEKARRWTIWHNNDLVTKMCAALPLHAEVLDVACGSGTGPKLIRERRPDIIWHACDFSCNSIKFLREHSGVPWGSLTIGDATKALPFEDNQFQVVLCTELLEHLEEPHNTVKELVRVARELVITTVPFRNAVASYFHVWSFEIDDLIEMFRPYGETTAILAREDRHILTVCRKHLKPTA